MSLKHILIGIAIVVGLGVLDRLLLRMEARGWVYYRRTKGGGRGAAMNALTDLHANLDPGARHMSEERQIERSIEDRSGDPPETGRDSGSREQLALAACVSSCLQPEGRRYHGSAAARVHLEVGIVAQAAGIEGDFPVG